MKQKDILVIIILLFVFISAWIAGSLYHSAASSTISETTSKDIKPITPSFDTKTVNKLKERQSINPIFELSDTTPTPTEVPALKVSPQNASGGGKLLL
jgi:flagellar basal body-associated protein FliL